jgi:molybdopterin synthase catalytic subunit
MLSLYDGPVDVQMVFDLWHNKIKMENNGAFITFVGIVRDEDGIDGLSFDIYEPILQKWFDNWQQKASKQGAKVLMAHSIGDVPNHQSSYVSAVVSPKRKVALKLIDEFVEDFKASAPIWKYDLIDGKRVYAEDRSEKLKHSGLLGRKE